MISELKKIKTSKSSSYFFTTKDFEIIFDTYNILHKDQVPYENLIQAMSNFGIKDPENILANKYKELNKASLVYKDKFIDILSKEYKVNLGT